MDLTCEEYDAAQATAVGAPGAGKYLVAAYDTGDSNYETKFKVAADLYDKAIHQFEYATALKKAATEEAKAAQGTAGTPGTGYQGASDAYDAAAQALGDALNNAIDGNPAGLKASKKEYEEKLIARDNAKEANDEAERNYKQSMAKLYGTGHELDGSTSAYTTGDGSLYGKYKAAETAWNTAKTGYDDEDNFIAELRAYNTTLTNPNADVTAATNATNLETLAGNLPVSFFEGFQAWLAGQSVTAEKHNYYAATAQYFIDKKNYDEEYAKCFGTGGNPSTPGSGSYAHTYLGSDGTGNNNGTKKTLADKEDDLTTAKTRYLGADGTGKTAGAVYAFNEAVKTYNDAYNEMMKKLGVKEEKDKQKTDAEAIFTAAQTELNRALGVYNSYVESDALKDETEPNNVLRMFIKLANVVDDVGGTTTATTNNTWQHHPHQVVNDVAEFYYMGILEGGETSSKLIDSVTLSSKATTDMYKSFDFDINVAMKSVQVAYDENNNITATATPTELGAFAKLGDKTDVDTYVQWQDTQPTT